MVTEKETEQFLDQIQDAINFQVDNGLLTKDESHQLQAEIKNARDKLKSDLSESSKLASNVWCDFVTTINSCDKTLKRIFYLYGIPVWVVLGAAAIFSILSIVCGWLEFSIHQELPASVIAWSCLGGIGYSIYHLRKNIYQKQLTPSYSIYWIVYPLAAILFGLGITFLLHTGFIQIQAKPSYSMYMIVAFLGGMFQEWAIGTMKDIAHSIHKPSSS